MTATPFTDAAEDLPIGTYEPCQLVSVKRHEPTEENLKRWPELKPSWCFKFKYHAPDDKLHEHECVRFCNDVTSKMGALFLFVTDLCGGEAPTAFDPDEHVGKWYRCKVRKKKGSDDDSKRRCESADPIDTPAGMSSELVDDAGGSDGDDAGGSDDDAAV